MCLNIGNLLLSVLPACFPCAEDSTCIISTLEMTCNCKLLQASAVRVSSHVYHHMCFLTVHLTKYYTGYQIKEGEMGGACYTTWKKYIVVERLWDNIKMHLNWIEVR